MQGKRNQSLILRRANHNIVRGLEGDKKRKKISSKLLRNHCMKETKFTSIRNIIVILNNCQGDLFPDTNKRIQF